MMVVVGRAEADRGGVGGGVLAKPLCLDRRLGELREDVVHVRRDRQSRMGLWTWCRLGSAEGMGKSPAESISLRFTGAVIGADVFLSGTQERPLPGEVLVGNPLRIEGLDPAGKLLRVVGPGGEFPGVSLKPPCLARLASQCDRGAGFDRNGDRFAAGLAGQAEVIGQCLGQEPVGGASRPGLGGSKGGMLRILQGGLPTPRPAVHGPLAAASLPPT